MSLINKQIKHCNNPPTVKERIQDDIDDLKAYLSYLEDSLAGKDNIDYDDYYKFLKKINFEMEAATMAIKHLEEFLNRLDNNFYVTNQNLFDSKF